MKNQYDMVVKHILENQEKSYRIAYSYVHEKEAALDIVQNAICKALESYRSLRNEDAIKTWYYRIIVNEALQYIRKYKREISCEPGEMQEGIYVERAYEPESGVYEMICKLPEQMQTVVMLHYFEQLTLKEISVVTGVNLNTVKSRMYAALAKLKGMAVATE